MQEPPRKSLRPRWPWSVVRAKQINDPGNPIRYGHTFKLVVAVMALAVVLVVVMFPASAAEKEMGVDVEAAKLAEFPQLPPAYGSASEIDEFIDEWNTPKVWTLDKPSPFEETRVLNPSPTPAVLRGIRRNLDAMFPQLANTPIIESWAGMIESSPDIVPIIDAIDRIPGFHIATGFSGHGFGIGPGAGKAIAGMLTGNDTGMDLSEMRLGRFFDGSPIRPQSAI